jgi:hypothetical protein
MSETLDLDALLPPTKQLKIQGRVFDCKPLTVGQLIKVAQLEQDLMKVTNESEILPLIENALTPFIPEYKKAGLDLRIDQIREIVKFALKQTMPSEAKEAKNYSAEKKIDSAKVSPTSSTSTPVTG